MMRRPRTTGSRGCRRGFADPLFTSPSVDRHFVGRILSRLLTDDRCRACIGLLTSADALSVVKRGHRAPYRRNGTCARFWTPKRPAGRPGAGRIDTLQGCDQARRSESGRRPIDRSTSGQ